MKVCAENFNVFETSDIQQELTPSDLVHFKYASIIYVDVDTSFSTYSTILADNQLNLELLKNDNKFTEMYPDDTIDKVDKLISDYTDIRSTLDVDFITDIPGILEDSFHEERISNKFVFQPCHSLSGSATTHERCAVGPFHPFSSFRLHIHLQHRIAFIAATPFLSTALMKEDHFRTDALHPHWNDHLY
ncbi:hypothetical protein C0J52_06772 [Blattella germanica]|nr:hypothetical protein C0J52_06772 [Blattella germanica]